MRAVRAFILVVAALLGCVVYWRLGFSVGIPLVLLAISLAVVGPGNRWLWSALFPLVALVIASVCYGVFSLVPAQPEWPRLLVLFVLVTLALGSILVGAVQFKKWRVRRQRAVAP